MAADAAAKVARVVGILGRAVPAQVADRAEVDPGHHPVQIEGVGQQPRSEGAGKGRDDAAAQFHVIVRPVVDDRDGVLPPPRPHVEGGKYSAPSPDKAFFEHGKGRQQRHDLRRGRRRERYALPLSVNDDRQQIHLLDVREASGRRDFHLLKVMDADAFDIGGGFGGYRATHGDGRSDVGVVHKVHDGPPKGWGQTLGRRDVVVVIE